MRTSLPRRLIALSLLIGFLYSCNKDPQLSQQTHEPGKPKLRVKKSKEEKEKKAKGYADFMKSITTPMDKDKSGYDKGHFFKEFLNAKKRKEQLSAQNKSNTLYKAYTSGITWEERGPGNVPGRLRQIAIHPTNKSLWYIGTVGGGVWKTEDAGKTFANLTDFKIPNLATSNVVLSSANPSTLYAGTGEPFNGTGMISGVGVIKSTDEGENWTLLENTSEMGDVARMFISQTNENIVVIATTSGIYKTIDGGTSWNQTYSDGSVHDLKVAPSNPNILYAFDDSFKSIIKSTDQGDTWSTVYSYMNNDDRIELAISHQNPNKVYGSVYTNSGDLVILSTDGGTTWNVVEENAENLSNFTGLREYMGGQGWYDNTINVHPTNDNVIYMGGVNLFKSTISDVGGSFERLTEPITDVYGEFYPQIGKNLNVHPDQHTIEYIYGENGEFQLIVGNDGGIAISNMGTDPGFADGDWTTGTVTGLNNTQFYGADKRNGVDQYIAGAQDNGTYVSPKNPSSTSRHNFVIGGDGFECVWNYRDPNLVLGASQNNGMALSTDGGATFTRGYDILAGGPFITRFANAKNNPDVVFAFNGEQGLHKTTDFGQNWEVKTIPYRIAGNDGDVAVSTANPAIVWAGKAAGNLNGEYISLYVSSDEGETFTSVTPEYTGLSYISGIETHPTDPNTAYLLMSIKGHSKIMRTQDLGKTWKDITGFAGDGSPSSNGFPDVPTYSLLAIPNTDVLWAGTEIGIFQSLDNGGTWEYLDDNIPAVSVWDMKVVNDEIVISTYGRGLWTASVPELIGYEPPIYSGFPTINSIKQTWREQTVTLQYSLPYPYSESKIYMDDVEVTNLGTNEEALLDQTFVFDNITPSNHTIKIVSTQGNFTREVTKTIEIIDFESITEEYLNDFNGEADTYNLFSSFFEEQLLNSNRFTITSTSASDSWENKSFIMNQHQLYQNSSDYIAMIERPIFVRGDETSKISFIDMAIVEPGDDSGLWDYVVVEGTKDGKEWIELTPKYDASKDVNWETHYNLVDFSYSKFGFIDYPSNESYYLQEEIDLNDFFEYRDVILVRYRLNTDSSVQSLGWLIDNIVVQEPITDAPDLITTSIEFERTTWVLNKPNTITFTIENQGTQDASQSKGNFYYSSKDYYDDEAVFLKTHSIPPITAGAQETFTETIKISEPSFAAGDYYLHYIVDAENTVTELVESNNFSTLMFSVALAQAPDNFIIKVENETCENKDNGSINVTAKETLNYTYTLSNKFLSEEGIFTNVLSFDNLTAGTYTLCFGLENNTSYEQCFDIVVGEPSNLLASTVVNKVSRTATVNITGGTAPYNINLNGRTYSVNTTSIDLPLAEGSNTITISSDIVCEGTVVDVINTKETSEIKAYPNPIDNQLFITIPSSYSLNQIPIQIYNAKGQLIMNNFYSVHNSKVEMNAISLASGLYFVKVSNLETVKIIKK